ncbi:MAG: AAA-like domain-containing protein [Cyanobacteria bacterium P01_F01_bin.150]
MSIPHVLSSGYIERDVDNQLFNALKSQQFCAVFAPPQSGKTSLLHYVSVKLMEDNIVCLTIDLGKANYPSQYPSQYSSQPHLLQPHFDNDSLAQTHQRPMAETNPYGHLILSELWLSMTDLPPDHLPFWLSTYPSDTILPQLDQLLEEILLVHCEEHPVVVFVDGLDAPLVNNSSVQELLALARRCYNRRSHDPIYQRLTFCLLGDGNPEQLLQAENNPSSHNPFPIYQFIAPQDFAPDQAIEFFPILADVLADPHLAIRMIVQLTGGQPLLTHQLCHLVRTQALTLAEPQSFDLNSIPDIVRTHMPDADHFQRVRDRLFQTGPLLEQCLACYQRLLLEGDRPIVDIRENDAVVTELCLTGLVVREGKRLAIASPFYQDMFDRSWLLELFNHYRKQSDSLSFKRTISMQNAPISC